MLEGLLGTAPSVGWGANSPVESALGDGDWVFGAAKCRGPSGLLAGVATGSLPAGGASLDEAPDPETWSDEGGAPLPGAALGGMSGA